MTKKDDNVNVEENRDENLFKVAHSRMFSAVNNYYIWKHLELSININNEGKDKAEENVGIINDYGYFLHPVFPNAYKGFVGDLSIFLDSNKYEDTFSLDKLIATLEKKLSPEELDKLKEQIKAIKTKHGVSVAKILALRNSDVAHQKISPERQKILFKEIESLFQAVQEILNLISKYLNDSFTVWDHLEAEISNDIKRVLANLKRGETVRLEEIQKKYEEDSQKP